MMRALLALVASWGSLVGQVYIVDVANGPGAHFTSLATAVASAPDGATLVVRPGDYVDAVTISQKGLTILAEPGARLRTPMTAASTLLIDRIAAHQAVVIRGLRCEGPPPQGGTFQVRVAQSAGLVALDGVTSPWLALVTDGANQLAVGRTNLLEVALTASRAVFTECQLHGVGFPAALSATNSEVLLVRCDVHHPLTHPTFTPPVLLSGAILRTFEGTAIRTTAAFLGSLPVAVGGTGAALLHPGTTLVGAGSPSIAPTVGHQFLDLPSLSVAAAGVGGQVAVSLVGPAGVAGVLAVAFPGPPWAVPFILGDLWLGPASAVIQVAGVLGATPLVGTLNVPNQPALRGLHLVWQGLSMDPVAGALASNPGHYVVY